MRRGDVVTASVTGDFGKPRPAVIVQTDTLPAGYASWSCATAVGPLITAMSRAADSPAPLPAAALRALVAHAYGSPRTYQDTGAVNRTFETSDRSFTKTPFSAA